MTEKIQGTPIPEEIKKAIRKEWLVEKYPNGFRRIKKDKKQDGNSRHKI